MFPSITHQHDYTRILVMRMVCISVEFWPVITDSINPWSFDATEASSTSERLSDTYVFFYHTTYTELYPLSPHALLFFFFKDPAPPQDSPFSPPRPLPV